ncbi:hypothetical protein M9458_036491, partial [Cirrhinus mrigala]
DRPRMSMATLRSRISFMMRLPSPSTQPSFVGSERLCDTVLPAPPSVVTWSFQKMPPVHPVADPVSFLELP